MPSLDLVIDRLRVRPHRAVGLTSFINVCIGHKSRSSASILESHQKLPRHHTPAIVSHATIVFEVLVEILNRLSVIVRVLEVAPLHLRFDIRDATAAAPVSTTDGLNKRLGLVLRSLRLLQKSFQVGCLRSGTSAGCTRAAGKDRRAIQAVFLRVTVFEQGSIITLELRNTLQNVRTIRRNGNALSRAVPREQRHTPVAERAAGPIRSIVRRRTAEQLIRLSATLST